MKSILLLFLSALLTIGSLTAQNKEKSAPKKAKTHKIVFQMVSKDTADHNAMVRQLFNLQRLAPGYKVGSGLSWPGNEFYSQG
ncbi:MAG: hypothetical protein IPO37_16980 [Saprospiraceae bacterium]|nr:hypothetical protein [Saprospiraceae bacterium]